MCGSILNPTLVVSSPLGLTAVRREIRPHLCPRFFYNHLRHHLSHFHNHHCIIIIIDTPSNQTYFFSLQPLNCERPSNLTFILPSMFSTLAPHGEYCETKLRPTFLLHTVSVSLFANQKWFQTLCFFKDMASNSRSWITNLHIGSHSKFFNRY